MNEKAIIQNSHIRISQIFIYLKKSIFFYQIKKVL